MNIALIIAGGSGQRMKQEIPKQFINVLDKPVIIYTLEAFQRHPNIDAIQIVCIDGWHEILRAYCKQFSITKLHDIVSGGASGMESIYNGLVGARKDFQDEDLVVIHDAIRPMVSQEIISDNIRVAGLYGNAISVVPCAEAMLVSPDGSTSREQYPRDRLKRTQTPQAFRLGDLMAAHHDAREKGITNSIASCTLMTDLGLDVHFSVGSEKNIKLTTPEDIDIFKALLSVKKRGID